MEEDGAGGTVEEGGCPTPPWKKVGADGSTLMRQATTNLSTEQAEDSRQYFQMWVREEEEKEKALCLLMSLLLSLM